ncbi:MAG: P-II family nitrogen regulator [Nitrospirae bacterium]|nr:P-II family nitrogen regulator [Nitrospirota bacterium]
MAGLKSITCIVEKDNAERVVNAAIGAGAQGATISFAVGAGVRQQMGVIGEMIIPQKEMITIVAHEDKADTIFDAVVIAGALESPGKGFAYMQPVDRAVGFLE